MCVSFFFFFFLAAHAKVYENGNDASLFFKPTQPGIFFSPLSSSRFQIHCWKPVTCIRIGL